MPGRSRSNEYLLKLPALELTAARRRARRPGKLVAAAAQRPARSSPRPASATETNEDHVLREPQAGRQGRELRRQVRARAPQAPERLEGEAPHRLAPRGDGTPRAHAGCPLWGGASLAGARPARGEGLRGGLLAGDAQGLPAECEGLRVALRRGERLRPSVRRRLLRPGRVHTAFPSHTGSRRSPRSPAGALPAARGGTCWPRSSTRTP